MATFLTYGEKYVNLCVNLSDIILFNLFNTFQKYHNSKSNFNENEKQSISRRDSWECGLVAAAASVAPSLVSCGAKQDPYKMPW